jgi:hypothetical protein
MTVMMSVFYQTADCFVMSKTAELFYVQSGGINQTYSTSASLLSPGITKCDLPPEQLIYNGKETNFTSIHEPGFDFSCLYPGIPLIEYTIAISNDGQRFSDEKSLRVFDSVCMNCDDSGCVRKVRRFLYTVCQLKRRFF